MLPFWLPPVSVCRDRMREGEGVWVEYFLINISKRLGAEPNKLNGECRVIFDGKRSHVGFPRCTSVETAIEGRGL